MKLERDLTLELIRAHPERAALALERLDGDTCVRFLSRIPAAEAVPVLERMSVPAAAAVVGSFEERKLIEIVEGMRPDIAARLLRRSAAKRARDVVERRESRRMRALRSMLAFPDGSAGALMDPDVLSLRESSTAREALDQIRESAHGVRYNVYIVDAEQRLAGVVNLRELMLARPATRLCDLMKREPWCIDARDDASAIVAHRGWREVHCLPVVDENRNYLGTLRYRTLRALEDELFGGRSADADVRSSLAELLSASAGALLTALLDPSDRDPGRG